MGFILLFSVSATLKVCIIIMYHNKIMSRDKFNFLFTFVATCFDIQATLSDSVILSVKFTTQSIGFQVFRKIAI